MLKVRLRKLESKHKNLRTDEVEGQCTHIPEVGEKFSMFAKGLEFGTRVIETSEVTEIEYYPVENFFSFKTGNSTYELDILDEDKDPFDYARVYN